MDPLQPYDARPYDPAYPPETASTYTPTPPTYAHDARERPYDRRDRMDRVDREVTAGPFRFGLREGILGILGIFAILGLVLGILGFAAAFALDRADVDTNNNGRVDVVDASAAIPAILVSLLPFMAAPVLALGVGAWAGHASRDAGLGATAGAIGGFLGPILTLLLTGVGFALGAGATNLDLSGVNVPFGISPGWGSTIPYLFTGAGVLWMIANTLAGGLSGGLVGGILERRWGARHYERRRTYERGGARY